MTRRVVITGMGAVSPIGNTAQELWQGIKQQRCGIDVITHFDTSDYKVKLAGEVKNLDMEQYFSKRDLKFNDRFTQFARIAAKQAMADSGLDTAREPWGVAGFPFLHPDDLGEPRSRYGGDRYGSQGALFLCRHRLCRSR